MNLLNKPNSEMKRLVAKYLRDNVVKLYDSSLIKEMEGYAHVLTENPKAKRIHNLCLMRNKPHIAEKIRDKYPDSFNYEDDILSAYALTLAVSKKKVFNK